MVVDFGKMGRKCIQYKANIYNTNSPDIYWGILHAW